MSKMAGPDHYLDREGPSAPYSSKAAELFKLMQRATSLTTTAHYATPQEICISRAVMSSERDRLQKIALVISALGMGGSERVVTVLANHFAHLGHDVTIFTTYKETTKPFYPVADNVRLVPLSRCGYKSNCIPAPLGEKILRLRSALKSIKPDKVLSFSPTSTALCVLACMGTGIPVIASERTFPPKQNFDAASYIARRFFYDKASTVVMQTPEGLKWLSRFSPSSRGVLIPNPIDFPVSRSHPIRVPPTLNKSRRMLLAVGRFVKSKNNLMLIELFQLLAADFPMWDFAILGDGPEFQPANDLVSRFRLQERILLPGRVGNVGDWYVRADAFAFGSAYEGFPNALAEALAYGLPAVSFDIPGCASLINPHENGYLVEPALGRRGFEAALRSLLFRLLRPAPEVTTALRSRLSIDRVAQQWLAIPV